MTLPSGDVVIGGGFRTAGSVQGNGIIRWDGSAFHPLGTGVDYYIYDLNVLSNGDVVAVGSFYVAGGVPATSVARWNGSTWSPLGSGLGMGATGLAETVMPNGDLVVAGLFSSAGGQPVNNVARWNGTAWSPLGVGLDDHVYALTTMPNGDLIAGGMFTNAGGAPANYLARWDGANWSPLGTGLDYPVEDLLVLPNGDLVVAGSLTTVAGIPVNGIARWNGTTWSGFGSGCSGSVSTLTLRNGELIVGGSFTAIGGVPANNIARWNGTAWFPLGSGVGSVTAAPWVGDMTVRPNGDLVVVGGFTSAGTAQTGNVARWDGTNWSALTAPGFDGQISAMARTANGGLVVAGAFRNAEGTAVSEVAHFDGSGWSAMGGCFNTLVGVLVGMPNGDVVAGGAGGCAQFARWSWNGTWEPIGGGLWMTTPFGVTSAGAGALLVLPNGDLLVGGRFHLAGSVPANNIAKWDGTQWTTLGSGVVGSTSPFARPASVSCLARLQNGDIVAGGFFTTAGSVATNHIARWDGTTWWPLGSGVGGGSNVLVADLEVMPNGDLVAVGNFTLAGGVPVNGVARWDGSVWAPLGSGVVPASAVTLELLGNGDLIVGGDFTTAGGQPANGLARWDGANWHPLGAGVGGVTFPRVNALLAFTADHLVVGGDFLTADNQPNAYLARWGCPAGAGGAMASHSPYGDGCGYSGNDNFYEVFTTQLSPFDLSQSTLRFDYTGGGGYGGGYHVTNAIGAPNWHTPTSAPQPLTDDSLTGPIVLPFACSAPNGAFTQINVSSNGRVFTGASPGDPYAFYGNVATVLSGSQFCPLYGDLDPATGTGAGTIHVDIDTAQQAVHVTWLGVQVYGSPGNTNSFQLSMFANGDVEYRFQNCQLGAIPALTGCNFGGGQGGPVDISQSPVFLHTPVLAHSSWTRPLLGTSVTLETSPILGSSPFGGTLVGWMQYPAGIPLDDLGMPTCRQYVSADVILLFVPSAGRGLHSLTIPNDPSFLGAHLYSQGFAFVPGFNPLGAISSNGIDLRMGSL